MYSVDCSVGMVDDAGTPAVPASALEEASAAGWVPVPTTKWGVDHDDLTSRANFEVLEASCPHVLRMVGDEWRCLLIHTDDQSHLESSWWEALHEGRVISETATAGLVRRSLARRVAHVEGPEALEALPAALVRRGLRKTALRVLTRSLESEAVRAYLTLAAVTYPLPVVRAVTVEIPAHAVVVDQLVEAVAARPEILEAPLGGAANWDQYERWLRNGR